ncbi:hypothetical protein GGS21DRAFT_486060 [Xylaria nigripes]|nr:hypothetical protein GGS21DRAFT_486060 [Xylaria nigripes]
MPAIRLSSSFNIIRATPCTRSLRGQQHSFGVASRLRATQGYGDAKGDPVAEHPEKQKPSSKAQKSLEHPGPPPPDVGKGTANGPAKAEYDDRMEETAVSREKLPEEKASAQSGGSRSKEAVETGRSPTGGEIYNNTHGSSDQGRGYKAPQPKIHNEPVPGVRPGLTEDEKRDVERHNRDFEKTHGKAKLDPRDKVGKGFWSGIGGRHGGEQDWNA